MGAGPFAVGVDAETAVGLLAGQQRAGLGSLQDLGRVGGRGRTIPVVEQVPAGQVADAGSSQESNHARAAAVGSAPGLSMVV